jgi:hypothetical protein
MKRSFSFEFEDNRKNSCSFTFSDKDKIDTELFAGVPSIYLSKSSCLVLAKILIQMGSIDYSEGFHVHIEQNFDSDKKELFRLILNNECK